ncbi:MAG: hypothetical protein GY856_24765, partial [bacterium]|nr:hypothetical protein [bacterium]
MLSACHTEPLPSGQPPSVVATYAGGEVTREEYASWLESRKLDDTPDERPERLEQIALTERLAERALERAADQDPGTRILIAQAEARLLLGALREHLGADISFTDEDARVAFDGNPENAFKPRRWRLRNLFKKAPEDPAERDRVRREMEEIRVEVLDGADFAEMARRESESQTRFSGGNMGFVDPADLRPEIAAVIVDLEPGEISEVIETEEGWTLLTCYGFQEQRRNTFEDVAETVHQILHRRELRRRMAMLEEELVAAAGARYELETARRESAPADAVVLRFDDGRLSVAELERLLAERRPGASSRREMAPEALQQVMDRYLFLVMAGRRARELGLDDDPPLGHRVFWKRAEILALSEIERRVRERLVPLTESEIRAFFDNNRRAFRHPPEYELAVIRL